MVVDNRKHWHTKTFYGAVGAAILIVFQGLGIELPYTELYSLVFTWTGYSLADRLRKK